MSLDLCVSYCSFFSFFIIISMSTTETDGSGDNAVAVTKTLPHIPLEVLQQIATHLDRKSAFALTLTCKGLRDAGETKLYETVHLDAEAEYSEGTCCSYPAVPIQL